MKKKLKRKLRIFTATTDHSKKIGLPPGSYVYMGHNRLDVPTIWYFHYTENNLAESPNSPVEQAIVLKNEADVSWINVDGLQDVEIIKSLCQGYGIDDLIAEDILDTAHRPKIEMLEKYLFITLKMLSFKGEILETEQISIVLGKDFVLSFQEKIGDVFAPIQDRIRNKTNKIRTLGADYLYYSLIDIIVDNYFLVVEKIINDINLLEEQSFTNPSAEIYDEIQNNRKMLIAVHKYIFPLREALYKLRQTEIELIKPEVRKYFDDILDHSEHLLENIETARELNNSLKDTYLSELSRQTNRIMQVLTIISTIFIPLTFLVGVYGMNFKVMPELTTDYGYFILWGFMISLSLWLYFYFRNKKWL